MKHCKMMLSLFLVFVEVIKNKQHSELNLYKMPATSISDEELSEITKKAPLSEVQKIKLQQLLLNKKKVFCRDSLT